MDAVPSLNKDQRGDDRSFLKSMIFLGGAIVLLVGLYFLLDPIFLLIWGKRSGWYLDEYRTWGAKVWRMLYRCTSHYEVCISLPLLWAFAMFLVQHGLKRDWAIVYNKVHVYFIVIITILAFFAFAGLIMMPLLHPVE